MAKGKQRKNRQQEALRQELDALASDVRRKRGKASGPKAIFDSDNQPEYLGSRVSVGKTADGLPTYLYVGTYIGDDRRRVPHFWAGIEVTASRQEELRAVVSKRYGDDYQTVMAANYTDREQYWLPLSKQRLWLRPHLDISQPHDYVWFGRFFAMDTPDLARKIVDFLGIFDAGPHAKQKLRKITQSKRVRQHRETQEEFRNLVMVHWGRECCVTGKSTPEILRASHIKPWALSNDREKQEAENGLLLSAELDCLFDAGLVTFDTNGKIRISSILDGELGKLKIDKSMSLKVENLPGKKLSAKQKAYLRWHNEEWFRPAHG